MFRKFLLTVTVVALLSVAFGPVPTANAAMPQPPEKSLRGYITYLDPKEGFLYVGSTDPTGSRATRVVVDSQTVITLNGQQAQFSQLSVGDALIITFRPFSYDRSPVAQMIQGTRKVLDREL